MARKHRSQLGTAFINLAYVDSNEELYLALLSGLAGFGLVPVAAVHDPGSDPQLSRIYELIEQSAISFHDLSCVRLDPQRPGRRDSTCRSSSVSQWLSRSQLIAGIAGSSWNKYLTALRSRSATSAERMCRFTTAARRRLSGRCRMQGWQSIFLPAPFKALRIVAAASAATHVPGLKPYVSGHEAIR